MYQAHSLRHVAMDHECATRRVTRTRTRGCFEPSASDGMYDASSSTAATDSLAAGSFLCLGSLARDAELPDLEVDLLAVLPRFVGWGASASPLAQPPVRVPGAG